MKTTQNSSHRNLTIWVSLLMILALAVSATAQSDLCINVPDSVTGPPSEPMDGVVFAVDSANISADIGWTEAARYNLHSTMGVSQTGLLQLLRTSTHVYLSLVIDSPAPDVNETIVLALSTTTNHAEDWRIHIKLFDSVVGADGANRSPFIINYWRGGPTPGMHNTGWNDPAAPVLGATAWMTSGTKFGLFGGTRTLEMKIPIQPNLIDAGLQNAIYFPTGATTFKLYVDALSTNSLFNPATVVQSSWPENVEIQDVSMDQLIEHNTPDIALWGTASFDMRPACTGVKLLGSQTGVSPPAPDIQSVLRFKFPGNPEVLPMDCSMEPNLIGEGPTNIFFAQPENTGTDAAEDVDVTFKMANFGIPPADASLWTKIGCMKEPPNCGTAGNPLIGLTDSNPTAAADIPGGLSQTFNVHWAMTRKQSCLQAKGNMGHQCMVTELRSSNGSTRFLNASVRRNMNFVTLSKFAEEAEISGVGYGSPPAGRAKHRFILTVDSAVQSYKSDDRGSFCKVRQQPQKPPTNNFFRELLAPDEYRCVPARAFPKGMTQAMTWIARGYRLTGKHIIINGRRYETTSFVGGFGYVAGHNGPVSEWKQKIEGVGLQTLGENVYMVEVPPEQAIRVVPTLEAVEPQDTPVPGFRRWGLSLHAGTSIPHGGFSNVFNPGPNFGIDLEYRVKPTFSLEAIYGFHRFRGKTLFGFPIGDLNLHQFSVNGKVYGNTSPARPFFNFGGGVYKFDPGNTRGGLNIGGGVQFDVTPTVAVEGMYNFHNVFTSGSSTRFSTVQGGVRFRF